MDALRRTSQPLMGVKLSKKYEKRIEKNRTVKAGDNSFDRRKTFFPVMRTTMSAHSLCQFTQHLNGLKTNDSTTQWAFSDELSTLRALLF
jgi:hypothetical protein